MLSSMNTSKPVLIVLPIIMIMLLVRTCGDLHQEVNYKKTTSTPTFITVHQTPTVLPATVSSLTISTPSLTPSPALTITATPDFCNSAQWQDKIQVLSQDLFTALEPGGPTVFDRILTEQNPAWADFLQYDHGEMRSAGVIFHETAFGPELGTGINPAVLLVTYGVERNWELPTNGDLVSEVDHIRAVLREHESDLILGKVDLSQYPMVGNGATYALYRYFNGDLSKLEDWCHTYVQVYQESPLRP
jgi:hypothetical protein